MGRRRFAVVRVSLGLFLLAVAGLKMLGSRDRLDGSFLSSPQLQYAALTVEVLLGVWLLSGRYQRDAWLAALALFTVFSGISFYLTVVGQRSCPSCFGPIPVNPAVTLAIDLAILIALALCRPAGGERIARWVILATASMMFAGLSGYLLLSDSTLAYLRGESITVEPTVCDVGSGRAGEERTFTIRLTNHASMPIKLSGGKSHCGCKPVDLPIALAPGESRSINVWMGFAGSPGRFQHTFELFTDHEAQPVVSARFCGRVIE